MSDDMTRDDARAGDPGELGPQAMDAAREYNRPADIVPRESMWEAIRARRAAAKPALVVERGGAAGAPARPAAPGFVAVRRWPAWSYAAAAVALLAVGIGIGRSLRGTPGTAGSLVVAENGADSVNGTAFQVAATEHFGQVETLLTWVSATPEARRDAQVAAWSRDLLASTRLLMDSPAGADPRRRQLLRDLELVLVQLIQLSPDVRDQDRTAVDDLLRNTTLLLTRIRTSVPAGMAPAHD
ncbi:MAG: hypothetical protein HYX65_07500 [Gemmatimonadetes bacterium]|nr:hypothetical protein [Gemmatimonadota bacterium]